MKNDKIKILKWIFTFNCRKQD